MRTYGRIPDGNGGLKWVVVQTDANGNNDMVWVTTLIQVLKLNLGESPFYSQYGIPAQQSVVQQVFPDYYVALTQQAFAPYFASLLMAKQSGPGPAYSVTITTHQGVKLNGSVSIPT